jgi:DNA primase
MEVPLYVVEGESDALSLINHRPVVGIPGTGNWRKSWLEDWHGLDVIVMGDADNAGQKLGNDLKNACRDVLGKPWTARHLHAAPINPETFEEGTDANDLLAEYEQEGLKELIKSLEAELGINSIEDRAAE